MGSGGQQPVTQQTTQTRDPWSAAQPHLIEAMENARGLFQSDVGYQPFTGNTTAPWLNTYSQPGVNNSMAIGGSDPYVSTALQGARGYLSDLVSNQGLNPGLQTAAGQFGDIYSRALGNENPYLQGVINQQMDRANSAM